MKFKEIFNDVTAHGITNHKLFSEMATQGIAITGQWLDSIDKTNLDNYLYLNASEKILSNHIVADTNYQTYYNIATIISSKAYMLDGLYDTMFFDYDPLVNYDRTETQSHNEKIEAGDHITQNSIGARSQTVNNGARTDSSTSKTTAFDSSDYGKATDKTDDSMGASTDTISNNATVDTSTAQAYQDNSSGGYSLTVKGNIGVTTSQQMLESERQVRMFSFYNKVLEVLEEHVLMMSWEV